MNYASQRAITRPVLETRSWATRNFHIKKMLQCDEFGWDVFSPSSESMDALEILFANPLSVLPPMPKTYLEVHPPKDHSVNRWLTLPLGCLPNTIRLFFGDDEIHQCCKGHKVLNIDKKRHQIQFKCNYWHRAGYPPHGQDRSLRLEWKREDCGPYDPDCCWNLVIHARRGKPRGLNKRQRV